MPTPTDFPSKLSEIRGAMEREEWAKAIHDLENIGHIPDKFYAIASNVLFFLYLSRNQYAQLGRLSGNFDPAKSKDSVSALLLFRDKELEYPLNLPKGWTLDTWEKAIESHAQEGKLDGTELRLSFFFLSLLNRPRLLEILLLRSVETGEKLDDEFVAVGVRCLIKHKWFDQARRLLWANNLNDIGFERLSFLIDRAEKAATAIPDANDKLLNFLRYKWGTHVPVQSPYSPSAT